LFSFAFDFDLDPRSKEMIPNKSPDVIFLKDHGQKMKAQA
jgi:hypothetical protein